MRGLLLLFFTLSCDRTEEKNRPNLRNPQKAKCNRSLWAGLHSFFADTRLCCGFFYRDARPVKSCPLLVKRAQDEKRHAMLLLLVWLRPLWRIGR